MAEQTTAPDCINILWNAADAIDAGITQLPGEKIPPQRLMAVLVFRLQRLARFDGTLPNDAKRMVLKFLPVASPEGKAELLQVSCEVPPFQGIYAITTDPPPRMNATHGDCLFTLQNVDESSNSDRT